MDVQQRPLPVPDEETSEFWKKAHEHVLVVQRCDHCGHFAHPPVAFCPACHRLDAPSFTFEAVSGRGRVVSWTVISESLVSGFKSADPITNVFVRLDEQDDLLFMATLEPSDVKLEIGSPVEVVFLDVSEEISLPMFRLVGEGR